MPRNYAGNWSRIAKAARRQTHDRCCWCLWRKAVEVHHARYRCVIRGDLYGKEVPGRDVFPLCDRCHGYLHREAYYLEYRDNMNNRNTTPVILQLQLLYQIRRLPLGWVIFGIVGMGAALLIR